MVRKDLKEWAYDLLSNETLNESGFIDPKPVQELWRKHLLGKKEIIRQHFGIS